MKSRTGIAGILLMGLLSFALIYQGNILSAAAEETDAFRVSVPVVLPGGGTVRIESIDYVPRAEDAENESYAQMWDWENDPACLPAQTELTVPADPGTASFDWNLPADKAKPGKAYAFRISQVPGSDPDTRYDERTYLFEVFIERMTGSDGEDVIRAVCQIRDENRFGDLGYKPDACAFENTLDTPPAPPVPQPPKPDPQTPEPPAPQSPAAKIDIVPKTGDPSDITLYAIVAVLSLSAIIGILLVFGQKTKNKRDH